MTFKAGEILSDKKEGSYKLILRDQVFLYWEIGKKSYATFFDVVELAPESFSLTLPVDAQNIKVIFSIKEKERITSILNGLDKIKFVERKADSFEIIFNCAENRLFVADLDKVEVKERNVKIMIIDDSPTIQNLLEKTFESSPGYEVVAKAKLPSEAQALIEKTQPDVITLDLHMPEMNGVELYNSVIKKYSIPTVIISSVSIQEGPLVIEALNSGAIDYIQKPTLKELQSLKPIILEKVSTAAASRKQRASEGKRLGETRKTLLNVDYHENSMVVIGSSTGGVQALEKFILSLPKRMPPIVIVQHIPEVFSKAFAERLDRISSLTIKEAENLEVMQDSHIYIAPGGKQMSYRKRGSQKVINITDDPPVNKFKPSVDYLFSSVGKYHCENIVAVMFTGMGRDGSKGMKLLKEQGAITIAQNEETSAVFGMPKAAIELGCVDHILALEDISQGVCEALNEQLQLFQKKKVV